MNVTEHLNGLPVWELARMADCAAPHTLVGTEFLDLVRICTIREWDRLTEYDGYPNIDGGVDEIAHTNVPDDTLTLWATFVDLAAYREDVTEFGPIKTLDQAARSILAAIAQRLVYALVREGKYLDND